MIGMQYRKMSEKELKSYYQRYAHRYYVDIEGSGMSVRDCRSDRKVLGRSNLIFHLPMAGILVDESGNDYDIVVEMLPLWSMAQLIWKDFSQNASVLLGANVLGDDKKSFKSHFDVVLDSKEAHYIYIRDSKRVPDALLKQAVHYHLGNPEASAIIDRDNHYVFPLGLSYRKLDSSKNQYIIEHHQEDLRVARHTYQFCLKRRFGELPLVERQVAEVVPVRDFTAQRYEDELACQCSFVMDATGRLLAPECSSDKANFIGATMVATETWKDIAQDAVIMNYRSDCFSLPAEYSFEQRPEKFSVVQLDRIMMLAKKLQSQRYEKAKLAGMLDFLNTTSDENAWR